jgi:hypothetical protein
MKFLITMRQSDQLVQWKFTDSFFFSVSPDVGLISEQLSLLFYILASTPAKC